MQVLPEEGNDCFNGHKYPHRRRHSGLQALVEATAFQISIGIVIMANAIVIGFETDVPSYWLWQELEDTFLMIFACELALRLGVYGLREFFRFRGSDFSWNLFDFIIVTLGVSDRICTLIMEYSNSSGTTQKGGHARFFVMLMRTFRLMRILRIFKIFKVLKQLYLLASGMIEAMSAVFWVSVLCGLIVYICAIMTTRLIGRPEATGRSKEVSHWMNFRQDHFGTVGVSMVTLFELMAYPDMEKFKPVYKGSVPIELFLIVFIIFGSFTIVSLLTGVICESMIEKSRKQQDERRLESEQARRDLIEKARVVFEDFGTGDDDDGRAGWLGRGRFERCRGEILVLCMDEGLRLSHKDLDALFELVDYEGSGVVEIEELLYGMVQLAAELRPMSIMELRRVVVQGLGGVRGQVSSLNARMNQMDRRLGEALVEMKKVTAACARVPTLAPPPAPTASVDELGSAAPAFLDTPVSAPPGMALEAACS